MKTHNQKEAEKLLRKNQRKDGRDTYGRAMETQMKHGMQMGLRDGLDKGISMTVLAYHKVLSETIGISKKRLVEINSKMSHHLNSYLGNPIPNNENYDLDSYPVRAVSADDFADVETIKEFMKTVDETLAFRDLIVMIKQNPSPLMETVRGIAVDK